MSGLAVVTGGAGSLGLRIAERLHADGHELLLVDLADDIATVATGIAPGARGLRADLTSDEGVAAVVDAVTAHDAPLRVLVNSAGILRDARIGRMEPAAFSAVIAVNLVAAMRLTLALGPHFAEGSAIVNMSSRAGLGNFGQTNYSASKSGLVGFTRSIAQHWAPRVRANALAPSLVDSPMTRGMPDEVLAKLVAKIPAGRIGTPDDVAAAVSYLASDEAAYVTGQVLLECGGRSVAP